jgi:hypothetical protein
VVIHGVPIGPFSMDDGLSLLKEEIETFNPDLKLLKNPVWLSSQENRQIKRHASILIAVENAEQAQLAIEKRLCVAGNWLIAQKYKGSTVQTQCQNCQKFGHSTRACVSKSVCQICAGWHNTKQHRCNICNTQSQLCPHSILKCSNCGEDHTADSSLCEFKIKKQTQKSKQSQNS